MKYNFHPRSERNLFGATAALSFWEETVLRTSCLFHILDPFQVPAGIARAIFFHHNNLQEFSIAGAIPMYSRG